MTDITQLNAREKLYAASCWLSLHDEALSFGLKAPEDGLKLWAYSIAHDELAECCDEFYPGEPGNWTDEHFVAAIGYNPFTNYANGAGQDEVPL